MNFRIWIYPSYGIAINSYREAVRSKVLGSLLVLPTLIISMGSLMGQMSLHQETRIATNLGIFSTTFFGVIVGIYAMVTLLHTEFERRTIYTLLSKPIYRWQFLIGKFLGASAVCATIVGALCLVSAGMLIYYGGSLHSTFFLAYFLAFLQSVIISALTLLFATYSSALLSGLFAFGLFIAGNLTPQIEDAINHFREVSPAIVPILKGASWVLPNLDALNVGYELTYAIQLSGGYVLSALFYTLTYTAIVLILAITLFERKDFQ